MAVIAAGPLAKSGYQVILGGDNASDSFLNYYYGVYDNASNSFSHHFCGW